MDDSDIEAWAIGDGAGSDVVGMSRSPFVA